jgi:hypothetical protein
MQVKTGIVEHAKILAGCLKDLGMVNGQELA